MTNDDRAILRAIQMLKNGTMTTKEDVGQGWRETTAESIEMMVRAAKRLGLVDDDGAPLTDRST